MLLKKGDWDFFDRLIDCMVFVAGASVKFLSKG